jgi:hypothetical protein
MYFSQKPSDEPIVQTSENVLMSPSAKTIKTTKNNKNPENYRD